ncbi:benzoate 4-monooxygenase cytochrome P450 [Xylaria bambusicola]|uniref:benzoate 4-monooxygenase cytochrome P450 n=1 Tax=Xylaria bambusicola TaxID=326684 RepID=UPI002008047B|nr:benzoate 4-monooxygenase cytochrome P450 [Xylaria bambusicola]KAI0505272.1 benzoate 4-monooxygenase cytochrome P450 [Xylaria bambusicola]
MSSLLLHGKDLVVWVTAFFLVGSVLLLARIIYNVFLHPLSHIPGPFWARATGFPSWYYATTGRRHIWLWKQFHIYGDRIRPEPNTVLFLNPGAHKEIYGMKSNVRRSQFYTAFRRKKHETSTFNTIDVKEHAWRRKILNLAFTEKSVAAACHFIVEHVDRWHDLFEEEKFNDNGWSSPLDFTERLNALIFDITGDLCFGRSFDVKEPGENPLKAVPNLTTEYMAFYYSLCRSPFLSVMNWLKPRGLDHLFDLIVPPTIKQYNKFISDSVTQRIAKQKEQQKKPEAERRQDIFHFLFEARDPETNQLALDDSALLAESSLLVFAGTDTTSVTLSCLFFCLSGNPQICDKLVDEILGTFDSADKIVYGPKLLACTYLNACIDETMRIAPALTCDLPREVLPGGLVVQGEHYPPGTIVGTVPWADTHNPNVYGDAEVFRPERWIVNGTNQEEVARLRSHLRPFSSGPGVCAGRNLALAELMITVARTLYRFHIRRAPGSTLGGGHPGLGWGCTDENQFQVLDAFVSLRQGPELQLKKRDA